MASNEGGENELPLIGTLNGKVNVTTSQTAHKISKYGTSRASTSDDAVVHHHDERQYGFFTRGRDFGSAAINHKFTAAERHTLASYESLDYLPAHSHVYKQWLKLQPSRWDWDRWLMMGMIGVSVGAIGFLLHQIIDVIADTKLSRAREYIEAGSFVKAWGWTLGYSLIFVFVASFLVVYVRSSAASSGLPELIGFLNGTVVRHIFNVKTLVIKFLSCCCAVGSGLPIGPEGPMIHMGSLVGAGLSQFKSDTLRIKLPFFERFRNSEDRRNFISAGAAAGVASAFGAPVGGLLFSMEEVSSFWNQKLSWQIFFCAMVSTVTTDLLNSAFAGFKYTGQFGQFKTEKYILFQVDTDIPVNILAFIPALLLGVIGGLLGALFTFMNLKINRARRKLYASIKNTKVQKLIRLAEPMLIMIVWQNICVFLPALFPCSPFICSHSNNDISKQCLADNSNPLHINPNVEQYTCPSGIIVEQANYTWTNNSYNELATLIYVTGERAIHHLFTRNTHYQLNYAALFTTLVIYFIMACWASGTSISSGLIVPMLFIGALYGRIVGCVMVSAFGIHMEEDSYWSWMDPGAMALVGAASFIAGVSRLTMSLSVIIIEMTNDILFLLPVMATIMVAKWVGDHLTHPLYHAHLQLKCIPYLESEPIVRQGKRCLNLELFRVGDIMAKSPYMVHQVEPVSRLAELLLSTDHGGFPVITSSEHSNNIFYGFITRLEIAVLLLHENIFMSDSELGDMNPEIAPIDYQTLTLDKLSAPDKLLHLLQRYCNDSTYQQLFLNLEPYVNQSAMSVQEKFSLHRTYILFRTMGMRHLTVVNSHNQVVGIITRKDLMGFNLEERLSHLVEPHTEEDVRLINA